MSTDFNCYNNVLNDFESESEVLLNFATIVSLVSNSEYNCDELNKRLDVLKLKIDERKAFCQRTLKFRLFLKHFQVIFTIL